MKLKNIAIIFLWSLILLSCGKDNATMPDAPYNEEIPTRISGKPQSLSSGVLVYKAILNQSGTNAPTVTIIENTLGDIVWTRYATGGYSGTLTGAFPLNKTLIFITQTGVGQVAAAVDFAPDAIFVDSYNPDGVRSDDHLYRTSISIEVYP